VDSVVVVEWLLMTFGTVKGEGRNRRRRAIVRVVSPTESSICPPSRAEPMEVSVGESQRRKI